MSNKIFVLMFPNKDKGFIEDIINPFYKCTRCGKTNPFTKNKLPEYLQQLQMIAGKNKLPYPTKLEYTFECNIVNEITEKKLFGKDIIKKQEIGDAKLFLYFDEDLSEKDGRTWSCIVSGMYAAMKALI